MRSTIITDMRYYKSVERQDWFFECFIFCFPQCNARAPLLVFPKIWKRFNYKCRRSQIRIYTHLYERARTPYPMSTFEKLRPRNFIQQVLRLTKPPHAPPCRRKHHLPTVIIILTFMFSSNEWKLKS
jgi:hypothetical protein